MFGTLFDASIRLCPILAKIDDLCPPTVTCIGSRLVVVTPAGLDRHGAEYPPGGGRARYSRAARGAAERRWPPGSDGRGRRECGQSSERPGVRRRHLRRTSPEDRRIDDPAED